MDKTSLPGWRKAEDKALFRLTILEFSPDPQKIESTYSSLLRARFVPSWLNLLAFSVAR
jgi:hypothetical protein